ncbi:MAG: biotin/lipoyl-binding protein, partial [Hominimerdicola sp.]
MKKIIITLLCIAIVSGGGVFGYKQYKKSQDNKTVVDVVPVNLMAQSADMFDYSYSEIDGQIVSSNVQKVYLDTSKLVKEVLVKEGDTVKKGDTILTYDMTVVELELAQKENQVKVIESSIKSAKNELASYKTYKPSEDAPAMLEEPEEPELPEIPEEPEPQEDSSQVETPVQPIVTVAKVGADFQTENEGTKDDPFIINCNKNTVVETAFLTKIVSSKNYAELHVYDEDSNFLYMWIINGNSVKDKEYSQWKVSNGIVIDEESGMISVDSTAVHYGLFSTVMPVTEQDSDDSSSEIDDEPFEDSDYDYDYYEPDNYSNETDLTANQGNDYMYSKAEIAQMISEKESEIKELELEKKQAVFEYENAKKKKNDGKVVAAIDGTVSKIGEVSSDDSESEEESYEGEDYSADSDNGAFAVIEGEGGISVSAYISELSMAKLNEGTMVSVSSWDTGAESTATVTSLGDELVSYKSDNWGENPNNSTYKFTAQLEEGADFSVGDWVMVSLMSEGNSDSTSVYLPIHYVRNEDGKYYIMKADENGKLVKQDIKVGKVMYG